MKVKIRDDEATDDVGTWTIHLMVHVPTRRKRDDDRNDAVPDEKEDGGEERER